VSIYRSHLGQLGAQRLRQLGALHLGQATRAARIADLSAHGRGSAAIGGAYRSPRDNLFIVLLRNMCSHKVKYAYTRTKITKITENTKKTAAQTKTNVHYIQA